MSARPEHVFVTSLRADARGATVILPARPGIAVEPPREMGGDGIAWSPEHLLLGSVSACFWLTLRALAARSGVAIRGLTCRTTGAVEKTPEGLSFRRIDLGIDVEVDPSAFGETHRLIESARRACVVSRSLTCPVVVSSVVTSTSHLATEVMDAM